MAYNVGLRSKKYGEQVNIFDSEKIRWVTGGVTLDHTLVQANEEGRKELKIGTPLGKVTATGKHGPYDKDATDGREAAVLMLGESVDFSLGNGYGFGDQVGTAFDWARVLTARLPVEVTPELKQQLNNISFV